MSYADKLFKDTCFDIIHNGTSTEGENVRPKWEDGTPAYTIKKFGVINEYDLRYNMIYLYIIVLPKDFLSITDET